MIRQITQAWQTAQRQLAELRAAVERTSELAKVKVEADGFRRERERALFGLGEAVWLLVKRGELALPEAVAPQVEMVRLVERKQAAQRSSIDAILMEGTEAADRAKKKGPKTAVAAKGKKR